MIKMMLLGLLPIALTFLLLGTVVGLLAKKRGNNPWMWGGVVVALLTMVSWQKLPRWAGMASMWELEVLHAMVDSQPQPLANPDAIQTFVLRNQLDNNRTYSFHFPARYRAEILSDSMMRIICNYPGMEEKPDALLKDGVVILYITTDKGYFKWPEFYLKQIASNKVFGEFVGKQGGYDIYQTKNVVTGKFDKTWIFKAQDGQLVKVESRVNDTRNAWRNIAPDLAVRYNYSSKLGNDYIKIDEVVVAFIKTHSEAGTLSVNAR